MNYLKPANIKELKKIIKIEIDKNGNKCNLNHIDVSGIDSLNNIFFNTAFNGDISQWDVSNVKTMSHTFSYSEFNGDISQWDVSKVENASFMFYNSKFNGNISKWNVSNMKNISNMFNLSPFNQNINDWDIRKVYFMLNVFDVKNANTPYWNQYETQKERFLAYERYQLNNKLKKILKNENEEDKTKV